MKHNSLLAAFALAATVLGGAGLLLYTTGLKPGIDLAGGSTLVYEVEVREGESTKLVIESTIETLKIPEGEGIRFDTMLYEGYVVPPFYDSLLGKLIVRGPDRESCQIG